MEQESKCRMLIAAAAAMTQEHIERVEKSLEMIYAEREETVCGEDATRLGFVAATLELHLEALKTGCIAAA